MEGEMVVCVVLNVGLGDDFELFDWEVDCELFVWVDEFFVVVYCLDGFVFDFYYCLFCI